MFKVYQISNGRWQITTTNPSTLQTLPSAVSSALLWRSYATKSKAAVAAYHFTLQIQPE
jgi:hypothetical protein